MRIGSTKGKAGFIYKTVLKNKGLKTSQYLFDRDRQFDLGVFYHSNVNRGGWTILS